MEGPYDVSGYVLSRVFQTVLVLFLLLYIWSFRADAARLLQRTRSLCSRPASTSRQLTEKQKKFRQHVADEFQKWRLNIHGWFLRAMLPMLSLNTVFFVVLMQDAHDLLFLLNRLLVFVLAYGFCVLIHRGTIPLSSRFLDVVFVVSAFLYVGRTYSDYQELQTFTPSFRRLSTVMRCVCSATYLSFPRAALGNIVISVFEMICYSMFVGLFDVDWLFEVFSLLFELTFILILAYVMEAGGRLHITQRLEGRSSAEGWRALRSILSVLCDAVVHLGSDLTLLDECPQLGHLLMSGIGASHKLEGGNMLRYVVEEDKQRLKDFISQQAELAKHPVDITSDELTSTSAAAPVAPAGPAALHISLKDAMGTVFRVEVIHAHLPNFDEDGHLLGVRDLGDCPKETRIDGIPARVRSDETLAQQRGSSSSSGSSNSGEIPSSLPPCKLKSLSLQVDSFDEHLPISEATLRFQSFGDEMQPGKDGGFDLPSLFAFLPKNKVPVFRTWVQDASNRLHYDMTVSPFGKTTLKPFGSALRIKSKRVSASADEEMGRVRLDFGDVDVQLSETLRRSQTSLPCIDERLRTTRSAARASPVISSCGNAPRQNSEASQSREGQVDSNLHLRQSL
eukprot:TRINITY_DN7713_c0_g1_i4.p1 TRINITY_DN7713_c0_g1~~TRINITY_DN7713_c0_g1_i4.p1  ORF type:complete len:643 (-),score=52.02 TRINITY_DN7713_c0_g1_i4:82-1944(-)